MRVKLENKIKMFLVGFNRLQLLAGGLNPRRFNSEVINNEQENRSFWHECRSTDNWTSDDNQLVVPAL